MTGILWAVVQEPIALPPLYQNQQAHHVELFQGVERDRVEHLIGLPMTIGILEAVHNDRIQLLTVALPTWAKCQIPHPHIVLSWVNGAAPVEANAMLLSNDCKQQLITQEALCTTVEWMEWGDKPFDPRRWRDRPKTLCPSCLKQDATIETRSKTGYCRKHRNVKAT